MWDVMLVWRKRNINKTVCAIVLCTIVLAYDGTSSSYRLIDWLYQALILLGQLSALWASPHLRSLWWYIFQIFFCYILHFTFNGLSLSGLPLDLVNYDTVGWVIWPVKLHPKWPIWCPEWDVKPYYTIPKVDWFTVSKTQLFLSNAVYCKSWLSSHNNPCNGQQPVCKPTIAGLKKSPLSVYHWVKKWHFVVWQMTRDN